VEKVMVMRFFIIPMAFLFTVTCSIFPKILYTGKEKVSLINTIEGKNCFISYVIINGRKYLLKQKKDYKKQLAVVRDALAAYIAEDLKIAHQIDIIESNKEFPGKVKAWWPATLHTLASGDTVRKQPKCKYNALRLRQFWAQAQSFSEKGLTKAIISHMTWHRQLPEIIALDLITGNSDRHCGNLCYDPTMDTFCAIDMDDTFNKDLCLLAAKKLKFMIREDKVVFTKEEIRALTHMRNTLKFLVRRHPPDDLIKKLYFFAKKAGFSQGSKMYDDRIGKKLLSYKGMIKETYASAYKLISLLDKIISHTFPLN
jgi:hypothetical protein